MKTRRLTFAQELRMARQILEGGGTYEDITRAYGFKSKQKAYGIMCEMKRQFPEFVEYLQEMKHYNDCPIDYEETTPDKFVPEIKPQAEIQPTQTQAILVTADMTPTQQIIGNIENTLQVITKLHPEEVMAMKVKDRLKLIEPLVKTLRLMQGESTQNIKKLSLIKAVGIATSRRKPAE